MKTKYVANPTRIDKLYSDYPITEVTIDRETDASVWIDGDRHIKNHYLSLGPVFFDSEEEAKQALIRYTYEAFQEAQTLFDMTKYAYEYMCNLCDVDEYVYPWIERMDSWCDAYSADVYDDDMMVEVGDIIKMNNTSDENDDFECFMALVPPQLQDELRALMSEYNMD